MAKKYLFKFSDGHEIYLGNDASQYCEEYEKNHNAKLVYNGFRGKMLSIAIPRSDVRGSDTFKPHYSATLGKYISTRGQFDKECKKQGYYCAGNEPPPQYEVKEESCFTDKDIKKLHDDGVKLSGNEVKKLKEI